MLQAWVAFMQAHDTVVDAVEGELLAERGLPLSWYEVLARLAAAPEGYMRMQDLAKGALLTKSGLTRLFDRMALTGLVERRSCPTDRRVTYAALTGKGRRTLENAAPLFLRALEDHFAPHLGDADRFRRTLQRLIEGTGSEPLGDCHSAPAQKAAAGGA